MADATKKVDELIRSAQLTFQLLEPWYQAKPGSSRSPAAKEFISRIKVQVDAFIITIEKSLDCSKDGLDICRDVLDVYDFLVEERPLGEVLEFLEDTRAKARAAHTQATQMCGDFATIHRSLLEIYQDIYDHKSVPTQSRSAKFASEILKLIPNDYGAKFGAALGAACAPIQPWLALILPAVVSLVLLVLEYVAGAILEKEQGKATEVRNDDLQLQDMQKQLCALTDEFVDWWREMEESIQEIQDKLRQSGIAEARNKLVRGDWDQLKIAYTTYYNGIQKLRDCYPNRSKKRDDKGRRFWRFR